MATRVWPDQGTHPTPITGPALATAQKTEGDALWNGVINQVRTVGGSANAITGVNTPALTAAPADGQTFRLTPTAPNTSAVQVNLDARGLIDLRDQDGNPLVSGDLVAGRPILFWYDAVSAFYRLCDATTAELLAAMAAQIAAAQEWQEIGDTTISVAVTQVEHTFTAGTFAKLLVIFSGLSCTNNTTTLQATLRNAAGAIVTLSINPVGTTWNASDNYTGEARFLIDLVSATKYHFGTFEGGGQNSGVNKLLDNSSGQVVGNNATAPDRVRLAMSPNGNLDAGRVITKGLKA